MVKVMENNDVVNVMDIVSLLLIEKDDGSLTVNFQFNEDLLNNLGVDAEELLVAVDRELLAKFSEHVFVTIDSLMDKDEYIKEW